MKDFLLGFRKSELIKLRKVKAVPGNFGDAEIKVILGLGMSAKCLFKDNGTIPDNFDAAFNGIEPEMNDEAAKLFSGSWSKQLSPSVQTEIDDLTDRFHTAFNPTLGQKLFAWFSN